MNSAILAKDFQEKVCKQVRVVQEGLDRYVIFQPFMFDDGDHFVVILKKEPDGWTLTDEGHTLMHAQYDDFDLTKGARGLKLNAILNGFSLENRDGELRLHIPDELYGDALYSYLQALNKITDLEFLRQEGARSTFLDDVRFLMEELIPENRRTFKYYDPERDPKKNYEVDCRINGLPKPNFVFFINNTERCQNATIVCRQYESWQIPFRAVGIFENQPEVKARAVAQFTDIAYKPFSSLSVKDRIKAYFEEVLSGQY